MTEGNRTQIYFIPGTALAPIRSALSLSSGSASQTAAARETPPMRKASRPIPQLALDTQFGPRPSTASSRLDRLTLGQL